MTMWFDGGRFFWGRLGFEMVDGFGDAGVFGGLGGEEDFVAGDEFGVPADELGFDRGIEETAAGTSPVEPSEIGGFVDGLSRGNAYVDLLAGAGFHFAVASVEFF